MTAGLALKLRLSGTSKGGNAEHVVLVGGTQCGKSTVAHSLLAPLRNLIIIDAARKGQFDHLGHVSQDPDDILRHPVVIWQPPRADIDRPAKDFSDSWSRGLWHIREVRSRSGVTVYHDEARVTLPTSAHPWAREMLDLGAGKGVGVIAATQGFSGCYPPLFDGATHWFLFRVANAGQRGSMAASLGVEGLDLARLPPHQFFYWRTGQIDAAGPFPTTVLGPRTPR